MAEKSINAGSVVRLKSGGPTMTVRFIRDDNAICTWFDDKKETKDASFPIVSLSVVEPW